jgi:hypothetical protein
VDCEVKLTHKWMPANDCIACAYIALQNVRKLLYSHSADFVKAGNAKSHWTTWPGDAQRCNDISVTTSSVSWFNLSIFISSISTYCYLVRKSATSGQRTDCSNHRVVATLTQILNSQDILHNKSRMVLGSRLACRDPQEIIIISDNIRIG